MKINREIRAEKVRVIGPDGSQIGILTLREALAEAQKYELDLVEIAPAAKPPVCKIINYGKFMYHVTKKEKESKKAHHQVKVKEIKVKPNIDIHDFQTKAKHARDFLLKGNKVRVSCMFRGREMLHMELGEKVIVRMSEELADISAVESPMKRMGRILHVVLVPQKSKNQEKKRAQNEDQEGSEEQI